MIPNRLGEKLVIHDYYYVVLLIDSSQSMLWPYLQDEKNFNQEYSPDYKNAVRKVQGEISAAHERALKALRNSRICKDRYLKVYQYTFNHRKKLLNGPEELSPLGKDRDNVEILDSNNYNPESTTALYDVIDEALDVVEENYLKNARNNERRIDKIIIGVITDGEDTVLSNHEKIHRITEIKEKLKALRDKHHLYGSVMIGLTSDNFTSKKLNEVREELLFDEAISIKQTDEKALRKAFKLFSDTANG